MSSSPISISDAELDALQNATPGESFVAVSAEKTEIVKHLSLYKAGDPIPDPVKLKLNYDNGTVIQDEFEHYLGAKGHYSTGSFVKLALGHPLDFQWDITEGVKDQLEKFKDRSYFDLGRFLHMAVLEPNRWSDVIIEPIASRASHEGLDTLINFWENALFSRGIAFVAQDPDKTDSKKKYIDSMKADSGLVVLDEKQYLVITQLRNRWVNYQDGLYFDLLKQAHKEVSMYTDNYSGLPMRVRPDGLLFENQIGVNAIVSVKTTSAPTLRQYRAQAGSLGYMIKESAYQDIASHITGLHFNTTISIVFQTVEPFNVGVFLWSQQDIEVGRIQFNDAVMEAKQLLKTSSFPGWDELAGDCGIIDMSVPSWATDQP